MSRPVLALPSNPTSLKSLLCQEALLDQKDRGWHGPYRRRGFIQTYKGRNEDILKRFGPSLSLSMQNFVFDIYP